MVLHHFASHMTPSEYVIANSMTSGSSWLTFSGKRLRSMEFECLLQRKVSSGGDRPLLADRGCLEGLGPTQSRRLRDTFKGRSWPD